MKHYKTIVEHNYLIVGPDVNIKVWNTFQIFVGNKVRNIALNHVDTIAKQFVDRNVWNRVWIKVLNTHKQFHYNSFQQYKKNL
jgi:hypothetical protein